MNGTVFYIGVTTCGFTMATIVEHHPQNVIGTFWLPSTEKDYNKLTVNLLTMMEKNDAGIIKTENLHQEKNIQPSFSSENFKPF